MFKSTASQSAVSAKTFPDDKVKAADKIRRKKTFCAFLRIK
jgi:hypothetical protein